MLFMVIEHFNGNAEAVGARFMAKGRMLPEGVTYQASWMEASGARCFQIMEAPSANTLNVWIGRWSDLVEFEVTAVLTSADYWRRTEAKP